MKKRTLGIVAAGALALGIGFVNGAPAFAAQSTTMQTAQSAEQGYRHGKELSAEAVTQKAKELGISTEGNEKGFQTNLYGL